MTINFSTNIISTNHCQEYAVFGISRLNSGKFEAKFIILLQILNFHGTGRKCFITINISYKAIHLILGRHSPLAPPESICIGISPCHCSSHILLSKLRTACPQLYPTYLLCSNIGSCFSLSAHWAGGHGVVLTGCKAISLSGPERGSAIADGNLHSCGYCDVIGAGLARGEQCYLAFAGHYIKSGFIILSCESRHPLAVDSLDIDVASGAFAIYLDNAQDGYLGLEGDGETIGAGGGRRGLAGTGIMVGYASQITILVSQVDSIAREIGVPVGSRISGFGIGRGESLAILGKCIIT